MSETLLAAPDKVLHALLSFIIAWVDPALALVAGLLKELWDLAGHGVAEWADLGADLVGIGAALLLGA